MDEKMIGRLRHLLAKRTKATIRPTMILQSIGGPKAILEDKPSMMLYFRRGPSLPNNGIHDGMNETKKLGLVSRSRGVLAVLREFPCNIIFHLLIKLHVIDLRPKVQTENTD
jgi:hypothetical protein